MEAEKHAWGLPTLPNFLFNLEHILNLTQKFNYQNYSPCLLRSPALGLKGQACSPLATEGASGLLCWVPGGVVGRGLALALRGLLREPSLSFLIYKLMGCGKTETYNG